MKLEVFWLSFLVLFVILAAQALFNAYTLGMFLIILMFVVGCLVTLGYTIWAIFTLVEALDTDKY